MLPVFIINLDRSPDRLAHMTRQCAAAGISFERYRAVDGLALPDDLKPYFCDAPLSPAEIGCYASHLGVWQTIVDRSLPAALVCEDDTQLPPDLSAIINDLLAALPGKWDVVRLCRGPKRSVRGLAGLSNGRQLVRYSKVPVGAAGYLVSLAGARKMAAPRKVWGALDVEIAHPWEFDLDVYGVVPPPIRQERKAIASTIGDHRAKTSRGHRLPAPRRLTFNVRKLGAVWWLRCWAANATRWAR